MSEVDFDSLRAALSSVFEQMDSDIRNECCEEK